MINTDMMLFVKVVQAKALEILEEGFLISLKSFLEVDLVVPLVNAVHHEVVI